MGLRVKEYFGMDHILCRGPLEIGEREIEKILLGSQHAGAHVIEVEKALQVGECVSTAQRLHARVGQRQAVAFRQVEDHLRLQRALNMDVQLGLGHAPQQRRQG